MASTSLRFSPGQIIKQNQKLAQRLKNKKANHGFKKVQTLSGPASLLSAAAVSKRYPPIAFVKEGALPPVPSTTAALNNGNNGSTSTGAKKWSIRKSVHQAAQLDIFFPLPSLSQPSFAPQNPSQSTADDDMVAESEYWDADYDPSMPTDYKTYKDDSIEIMREAVDWSLYLEVYYSTSTIPAASTTSATAPGQGEGAEPATEEGAGKDGVVQYKHNFGKRILLKQGWSQGQGLGASAQRQGILKPIRMKAERNRGRRGYGRIVDSNKNNHKNKK